jgi:hypothetical protein
MTPSIKEPVLRQLVESSALSAATANGRLGGFELSVTCGALDVQRLLANTRGEPRIFSNLNTLAQFLQKIGVSRFEVDVTNYKQARVRPARPDRAEALRKTRTRPRQTPIDFLENSR